MTARQSPWSAEILPAWCWLVVAAIFVVLVLAIGTAESAPVEVTAPLLAQLGVLSALIFALWKRRRGIVPWFEIGVVYAGIVTLYGVYSMFRFLVIGEHYNEPFYDSRWSMLDPSVEEVSYIGWVFVFHLIAFVVTYLFVRGRLPVRTPRPQVPGTPVFIAVLSIYLLLQVWWFFVSLFYNTSAESYIETYLISQRLPLILAQLLNHLNGMKYPLALVILTGLFAQYPTSRKFIVAWIAVLGVLTVVRLGSRTELALLVMASGMMYHTMIRPLAPAVVAAGVVVGVALFTIIGLVRGGALATTDVAFNPFLYDSEFDTLFASAIELARPIASRAASELPLSFYLTDLAALIPQQLAPFVKVDPGVWYVTTFYPEYAASGGGLAFGTMAEAVLTGGLASAAVRGAALGFCFAKIHRLYTRHADNYWVFVFNVWATTLCYQSFRGTTFLLLVYFVYRFLPVMIGVNLLAATLARAARRPPAGLRHTVVRTS